MNHMTLGLLLAIPVLILWVWSSVAKDPKTKVVTKLAMIFIVVAAAVAGFVLAGLQMSEVKPH